MLVDQFGNQFKDSFRTQFMGFGVPAFEPTDIPNLEVWFDASDLSTITETLGKVSQWDDKSGNANHGTQGTGADQPSTGLATLNSLNVLTYAGGNQSLDYDGSILVNSDYTVFIVEKRTTLGVGWLFGGLTGVNNQNLVCGYLDADSYDFAQWGNDIVYNDAGLNSSDVRAWCHSLDSTTGRDLRLNGISVASSVSTVQLSAYVGANVGSGRSGLNALTGNIAEFAVFSRNLTSQEKTTMENYLTNRWVA